MTVILASESGGYLYHKGPIIRAVAFRPLPELTDCDHILIPEETAQRVVRGELDHREWFVWSGRLFRPPLDVLELYDDRFIRIESAKEPQISLHLNILRDEQRIVFKTDLAFERCTVASLPLLFVRADDPSAVLFRLDLPMDKLQRERRFEAKLGFDLTQPFDIYTQPLFPCYIVAYDDYEACAVPSGEFVDLMKFRSGDGNGLQAVVADHVVKFQLIGDSIETYDRPELKELRLLFSKVGDPSLLLHGLAVPLAVLDGTEIALPPDLHWPFDIWSPLFFRDTYLKYDAAHH